MAKIDIKLDNVRNINAKIPRYMTSLNSIKRELEILRWKLDKETMDTGDMRERYNYIIKRINLVDDKMSDIHRYISSSVMQYEQIERVNKSKVSKFL